MLNNQKIPNLAMKFELDNVKLLSAEKLSKIIQIRHLVSFRQFFGSFCDPSVMLYQRSHRKQNTHELCAEIRFITA